MGVGLLVGYPFRKGMSAKISQYQQSGDSISLKKIDGQAFTIVKAEDSDYNDKGTTTRGITFTTEEKFTIDGNEVNKFHTTRKAIVSKLQHVDDDGKPNNTQIHADLDAGKKIGPVKCQSVKAQQGGKDYFDLIDA